MKTETTTRFCADCGAEKPIEEFYIIRHKRYAGGWRYSTYCKFHTIQRNYKDRKNAPEGSGIRESLRRAQKKWAQENPEANREAQKRWRENHPEEAAARNRAWQLANPEKNREKARRYYQKKRQQQTTGEE